MRRKIFLYILFSHASSIYLCYSTTYGRRGWLQLLEYQETLKKIVRSTCAGKSSCTFFIHLFSAYVMNSKLVVYTEERGLQLKKVSGEKRRLYNRVSVKYFESNNRLINSKKTLDDLIN